jgi:hypothetical protein
VIRGILAAAPLALALAPAATARIVVSPTRASSGQSIRLVFEAPNERDDAQVVSVRVLVPDTFRVERAESPPQWRAVRRGRSVEWSGGLIPPGATQRFALAGTIERTASFRATERFSDGDVANYEPRVVVPGSASSRIGPLLLGIAVGGALLAAVGAGLALRLRRGAKLQEG